MEEKPETVVLSLTLPPLAGTEGAEPSYLLGRQSKAAVMILDDDRGYPHCRRLSDGLFYLCRLEFKEGCYRIEVSEDMRLWETAVESWAVDGAVHYVDPEGSWYKRRFYRIVPVPCPEP
jgi:hypothetical protein